MSESSLEKKNAGLEGHGARGFWPAFASARETCMRWARRRPVQVGVGAALLLAVLAYVWRGTHPETDRSIVQGEMTHTVKRGNLRISFTEKGEIKASSSQEVYCEVEGRSTIVSVVPEGTSVRKGDILVELDSSELTQLENQQTISVEQATAAYESAQAQLEIQKSLNESAIQQAELTLLLAEIDLEKYTGEKGIAGEAWDPLVLLQGDEGLLADVTGRARAEIEEVLQRAIRQKQASGAQAAAGGSAPDPEAGEADPKPKGGPQPSSGGDGNGTDPVPAVSSGQGSAGDVVEVQDYSQAGRRIKTGDFLLAYQRALADVKIASAEVARAKNQKEWTEALAQKGYVTGTEVVADRLSLQKAELNEQQSRGTLQLFLTYTWRQSFEKYKSAVDQAKAALDRAKKKAEAELRQAETDLAGKDATLALSKKRLAKIQDQLTKTRILAPQDGMVVYHREGRWGRETMLEPGAEVSEQQLLMRLPDVGTMAVEVQVHESWVDQVRDGLPAYVSIDALPNLNLKGRVTKVGILPDQVNRWLNPDLKVYKTEITLEDSPDVQLLRPGMSAKVELIVTLLRDVVFVPVQSVTTIDKQQVCYVLRGGDFVPEPIAGGRYNESYIEVSSGLDAGAVIRLNAPPPQGSSRSMTEEENEEIKKDLAEVPPASGGTNGLEGGRGSGRGGMGGRGDLSGREGMGAGRQGMRPGRDGIAPGRDGMTPGRDGVMPGRERGQGGGQEGFTRVPGKDGLPRGRPGGAREPGAGEGAAPAGTTVPGTSSIPAASTEEGVPARALERPGREGTRPGGVPSALGGTPAAAPGGSSAAAPGGSSAAAPGGNGQAGSGSSQ